MSVEGLPADLSSTLENDLSLAVVDDLGRQQADAGVSVLGVVPAEEVLAEALGPPRCEAKRSGKPGRYLRVLNCASE